MQRTLLLVATALAFSCGLNARGRHPEPDSGEMDASLTLVPLAMPDGGGNLAEPGIATVVSTRGPVEVRRGEGTWAPVSAGERLKTVDSLRTLTDGEADVAVDQVNLRLYEHSALRVKSAGTGAVRARVEGRIDSEVTGGDAALEVEAAGSDAVLRSRGRASMIIDGRGVVAVAAMRGSVNLSSKGRSVEVGEGRMTRVLPNSEAEKPGPILRRVLMAVSWPEQLATNQRELLVRGKVTPGSRVLVAGVPAVVEPDGQFSATVRLKAGRQRLSVVAIGLDGVRKEQKRVILMDDRPNLIQVKEEAWQAP